MPNATVDKQAIIEGMVALFAATSRLMSDWANRRPESEATINAIGDARERLMECGIITEHSARIVLEQTFQSEVDLTNHHNAAKCPYCTPVQAQPQDDYPIKTLGDFLRNHFKGETKEATVWESNNLAARILEKFPLTIQAKDEQCSFTGWSHLEQTDKRCDFVAGHYGMHGLKSYVYHPNPEAPNDDDAE